jgi:hypothetical protein
MTLAPQHHLTAHWIDEDEGAPGILTHHHLTEVWTLDDEVPVSSAPGDDLTETAA